MTEDRLFEIKCITEKATDGPWEWIQTNDNGGGVIEFDSGFFPEFGEDVLSERKEEWLALTFDGEFDDASRVLTVSAYPSKYNAKFLSQSRTIVPELIAEVERLRELLGRLRRVAEMA